MKILWVGDVHATVRELDDVKTLFCEIERVALLHKVDRIHFAGDLYDNFALVNTHVMEFYKSEFAHLKSLGVEVDALKGNHDMSGDSSSTSHALLAHSEINVYDRPTLDDDNRVAYVPFLRDPAEFVQATKEFQGKADILFCHQEFLGAKYDNGFFSKEGIDPSLVPFKEIVSGHIHTPYRFTNVWYPGAPRWRTLSDASVQERFLYVFEVKNGLSVLERYNTGLICRRIVEVTLTPENVDDLEKLNYSSRCDYRVSISGPEAFVRATDEQVKIKLPGAKVASVVFDSDVKLRESEGIAASFQKWFVAFEPPFGTDKDTLRKMVTERIHV